MRMSRLVRKIKINLFAIFLSPCIQKAQSRLSHWPLVLFFIFSSLSNTALSQEVNEFHLFDRDTFRGQPREGFLLSNGQPEPSLIRFLSFYNTGQEIVGRYARNSSQAIFTGTARRDLCNIKATDGFQMSGPCSGQQWQGNWSAPWGAGTFRLTLKLEATYPDLATLQSVRTDAWIPKLKYVNDLSYFDKDLAPAEAAISDSKVILAARYRRCAAQLGTLAEDITQIAGNTRIARDGQRWIIDAMPFQVLRHPDNARGVDQALACLMAFVPQQLEVLAGRMSQNAQVDDIEKTANYISAIYEDIYKIINNRGWIARLEDRHPDIFTRNNLTRKSVEDRLSVMFDRSNAFNESARIFARRDLIDYAYTTDNLKQVKRLGQSLLWIARAARLSGGTTEIFDATQVEQYYNPLAKHNAQPVPVEQYYKEAIRPTSRPELDGILLIIAARLDSRRPSAAEIAEQKRRQDSAGPKVDDITRLVSTSFFTPMGALQRKPASFAKAVTKFRFNSANRRLVEDQRIVRSIAFSCIIFRDRTANQSDRIVFGAHIS
jgi:hypothetical protein